jgi:hypothetical protein
MSGSGGAALCAAPFSFARKEMVGVFTFVVDDEPDKETIGDQEDERSAP